MRKITRKFGIRLYSGATVLKSFAAASTLLALFVLFSPCNLKAQLATADVLGTVTDPSGAVVPDAKVTIHNAGTGITRTEKTNKTGEFIIAEVQIGTYKLTVEAKGFKTFVDSALTLAVGDRARVSAKLEVGSQMETVEVESAAAPALKTDSSTQDTLISTTAVADLPLNGRNITNLVQLSAGVTEGASNAASGGKGVNDYRQTSAFSANGQNDMYNNQMVDGLDNNERSFGDQVLKPSIDGTDQVIVMTNLYPAEYGRTEGGMMNVITKSGTNKIHGTAYEYVRNDIIDAYAYAFPGTKPVKGEYRQNQFGGSVGGPIMKNKAFFFGDYEGFRLVNALAASSATVPTDADVRTAVANAAVGSTVSIIDPEFPTASNPTGEYTTTVTQLGKNILSLYPHASQQGTLSSVKVAGVSYPIYVGNFQWDPKETQVANTLDTRIDEHLTSKDLIFGRYSWNKTITSNPAPLPAETIGSNSFVHAIPATVVAQGLGIDWVHTFSANLLLELKSGYNRFNGFVGLQNGPNAATELGFAACPSVNPNTPTSLTAFCMNSPYGGANAGLPSMGITRYASLGDVGFRPLSDVSQSYQYMGSLTWNHGNHSVKTGVSLIRRQLSRIQSANGRASYDDSGAITGSSLADTIAGIATGAQQQTTLSFPNFRSWEPSAYIQDDWRARPWLTLNLGVRYDIFTPFTDAHGQFSNFNYTKGVIQSPSLVGVYQGSRTDDVAADYSNISPRLGFSASLAHQMVVRGGIGVSNFSNEEGPGTVITMANFPYTWSVTYGDQQYVTPPAGIAYMPNSGACGPTNLNACALNLEAGVSEPFVAADTVAHLPHGTEIDGIANNLKSGILTQFSLEIQKQFGSNVLALGYIGNAGRHLPSVPDVNQAAYATPSAACFTAGVGKPGCSFTQGPTPYTSATTADGQNLFGDSIYASSSISNSNYNAMEVTLTRRLAKGLAANVNYTWAKAMDNGSPQGEGGNRPVECVRAGCLLDLGNGQTKTLSGFQDYDWGRSDLNVTQRLALMLNYAIPFANHLNGPLGYVLKGWNANSVFVYNTSLPVNITNGNPGPAGNVSGINGWRGGDTPNQVGNPSGPKQIGSIPSTKMWFNTAAFALQTPGTLGNVQRNSINGPNQRHWDMAISKDFPVWESAKLQFRAEAFNASNTPSFGEPSTGLGGPGFGQVVSVTSQPRLFQFALRLSF